MNKIKETVACEIRAKIKELNKLIDDADKNKLEVFLSLTPIKGVAENTSRKLLKPIIQQRIYY